MGKPVIATTRRHGVHLTLDDVAAAEKMYAEGVSIREIAERIGCTYVTVWKRFSESQKSKRLAKAAKRAADALNYRYRVLPVDNATRELFRCERLGCRLTVPACGERWKAAKLDSVNTCHGCDVGRENARQL